MNRLITEQDIREIAKAGFSNDEGETHASELANATYSFVAGVLHTLHREKDEDDLLIHVIHRPNSNFIHVYTPHRMVFFNHLKAIQKAIELRLVTFEPKPVKLDGLGFEIIELSKEDKEYIEARRTGVPNEYFK